MKRILHIVGGMDRAGAETMIMNLYRVLDKDKYQFDFVYFRNNKCDYDDEILKLGGRIFRITNTKNPILRAFKLKKLITNEAPFYAIQSHTLFNNAPNILAAYFADSKMRISHSHNTSDHNTDSFIGRLYQKAAKLIMAKYSTNFISCGREAGEYLFPYSKNVEYLLNAIDVKSFANNRIINRNFLRKEFALDKETIIITQIGRLTKVKNHIFSINFAKYLKESEVDFRLFFVGNGELKSEFENEIKRYELQDYVKLLGVRSDIPNILAGADVMIMPSLFEGFPVVLVESQASGVPSLISDSISSEVDMGIGLVKFESLSSDFSIWKEKLINVSNQKDVDVEFIFKALSEQGFDINESIKKLEKIYG